MTTIETIELDKNTRESLEGLNEKKQELLKEIARLDEIAQIILGTVINVKELTGEWTLGANMKLIKAPEFTSVKGDKS
jgi:hypothetical protein